MELNTEAKVQGSPNQTGSLSLQRLREQGSVELEAMYRAEENKKKEIIADQNWRVAGECNENPDLWFSISARDQKLAKAICRGCLVQKECLVEALEEDIQYGIRAGTTEKQRRKIKRERAASQSEKLEPAEA